jgi:hypothetical protein
MFLERQPKEQIEYYARLLKSAGAISRLFSEAAESYIAPRVAENLFCKAFGAENLSRSDVSADAMKDGVGIGIKTFLKKNGNTLEKIAEFNGDHALYSHLPLGEKVKKIAELRNIRIRTTNTIYGLKETIYHCVVREVGKIIVYETSCPLIDIDQIKDIKMSSGGSAIQFSDPSAEYSFNVSKSTLYKRFTAEDILLEIPIRILDDPFAEIEKLVAGAGPLFAPVKVLPHVFLPLYSMRGGKNVPPKSGLNQWNAGGRARNINEVYIPVPSWVHKKFQNFFPPSTEEVFELTLPDRTTMKASMCQQGRKALMSNPNQVLGKWILRDVLNLKDGEVATYEKLQEIGLDTVVVYKIDDQHYDIDFAPIGAYEDFLLENGQEGGDDEVPTEGEE